MICQEPMASFAPAMKIGHQMVEQLLLHKSIDKKEAKNISIGIINIITDTSIYGLMMSITVDVI